MSELDIELVCVSKAFGAISVVKDIDLQIPKGEFVSVLGPSGCGKTTTLNMIAGFNRPSCGDIKIRGRSQVNVPPEARNIGLVFQNYALFPHMTVAENVAFGLKMKRTPKVEIASIVDKSLRGVHLEKLADRYPKELSGGQQQRVALARALAPRPSVLLLDEPLSNLDLKLRESMRGELKDIQRELNMTFVYVTHDQEEAMAMSDRIVVMSNGVIAQQGKPDALYRNPVSTFVADFIGRSNIIGVERMVKRPEGCEVSVTGSEITLRVAVAPSHATPRYGVIRLEDVLLLGDTPVVAHEHLNVLEGRLDRVTNLGASLELSIQIASGLSLCAAVRSAEAGFLPAIGKPIRLGIDPSAVTLLKE